MSVGEIKNTPSSLNISLALLGSGFLGTVSGHPLDMLRARLLYGNQLASWSSFNRGLSLNIPLSIIKTGGIWPLQKTIQEYFQGFIQDKHQAALISGAISNLLPNATLAPLNIIKVHYFRDDQSKSYCEVAQKLYRTFGIKGFYMGMGITIVRDTAWGALYFPIETKLKHEFRVHFSQYDRTVTNGSASFLAAIFASTITSGIDALRLHQMNKDRVNKSLWDLIKVSFAPTKANVLATVSGVGRVAIGTTIAHTSYQYIVQKLESKNG